LLKPIAAIFITTIAGSFVAYQVNLILPGITGFIFTCVLAGIVVVGLYVFLEYRYHFGFTNSLVFAFPQLSALLGNKRPGVDIKSDPDQSP
jgi:hypothetical protein